MVLHNTYCSYCYYLSYSIDLGMIATNMNKACSQCGYIPARYICAQCGRIFCTSCMSEKDFVCNLCKIRGRRDEPNRSHHNFKQNLIQRHYLFPISIAIILSGIILIALSLSYFPFRQMDDNNEDSNTGSSSGFIYIFPLPFAIPIDSAVVPYAIPIVILIVIAIPILVLVLILRKLKL
jgi:hypothetical protein